MSPALSIGARHCARAVELIDEVLALKAAIGESADGDRESYDAIRALRLRQIHEGTEPADQP
jgi:hypothetical protein